MYKGPWGGGYSPWSCREPDMTEATQQASMHAQCVNPVLVGMLCRFSHRNLILDIQEQSLV